MRCSDCSSDVRPIVAIDIDGTLGDYHGHLIEFAIGYFGHRPWGHRPIDAPARTPRTYHAQMNWGDWFCAAFGIDRRLYRDMKLAYRQGGLKRTMPVYPGAGALVEAIREDAEIWITTSRPYQRLDNIDPDTRDWLDRNHIYFDHVVYDENKYRVLAQQVDPERVCSVLDDLPQQIDAATMMFGPQVAILRRTIWNSLQTRPLICDSLLTARAVIGAQISNWNIKHNFDNLPTTS